jgi:hypothetical protein
MGYAMAVTWDRLLAILIALGWAVAAGIVERSIWPGLLTLIVMLGPVGLICFADDIGRGPRDPGPKLSILGYYVKQRSRTGADRPSPPGMLVIVGWFLLVGLPVIILLVTRKAESG